MTTVIHHDVLLAVAPSALSRAERVAFALGLIKRGRSRVEVVRAIESHYEISRKTAYRIASIAFDLAEYL